MAELRPDDNYDVTSFFQKQFVEANEESHDGAAVYKFSRRFLGVFSHCVVYKLKDSFLLEFKLAFDNYSRFISYEEAGIMVDVVCNFFWCPSQEDFDIAKKRIIAGDTDADIQMLSDYMRSQGVDYNATIAHVEGDLVKDVSVELHATPAYFKNFRYNKRLQSWCNSYDWSCCKSINGFSVPSDSFNLVFLLVHLYHHFLYEGVGFRQFMDYYQFLMSIDSTNRQALYKEATISLQSFGMWRFTQGVMYLMKVVFCMRSEFLICEPDAKTGQLLLTDMLESGNMGKYHSNKRHNRSNRLIWHWTNFKRNHGFVSIAPAEILAAPFWSLWHWCWRKHNGIL